jgi:hypothetical protein
MNATSVYAAMIILQAKHIEEKERDQKEPARFAFQIGVSPFARSSSFSNFPFFDYPFGLLLSQNRALNYQ